MVRLYVYIFIHGLQPLGSCGYLQKDSARQQAKDKDLQC